MIEEPADVVDLNGRLAAAGFAPLPSWVAGSADDSRAGAAAEGGATTWGKPLSREELDAKFAQLDIKKAAEAAAAEAAQPAAAEATSVVQKPVCPACAGADWVKHLPDCPNDFQVEGVFKLALDNSHARAKEVTVTQPCSRTLCASPHLKESNSSH